MRIVTEPGAARSWTASNIVALGILTIASAYNYLDRSLLGYAIPLIQAELHISDSTMGLIAGPAFTVLYVMFVVPIAWFADNGNRRKIIGVGFAFWSVMTAFCGFAANAWQLALSRMLMGGGEASSFAPSQSILSDLFDEHARPLALGIFNTSAAVSGLCMLPIFGYVAGEFGWRAMFYSAGLSGVLCAGLLMLVLREPKRGVAGAAAPEKVPLSDVLRFLSASRSYVFLVLGGTFAGASIFISLVWEPVFLMRVHGFSIKDAAALIGPTKGITGVAGVLLGGYVATLFRGRRRLQMTILPVSCTMLGLSGLLFLLADARIVWMSGLVFSGFFMNFHTGMVYTAMLGLAKPRMRSVAIAVMLIAAALIGQGLGPWVVGVATDALAIRFDHEAIRYSLLLAPGCALGAAFFYLLTLIHFEADLARVTAAEA